MLNPNSVVILRNEFQERFPYLSKANDDNPIAFFHDL